MKLRISTYITRLLTNSLCLLLLFAMPARAQEKQFSEVPVEEVKTYQGIYVTLEVAGLINSFILKSDMMSTEVQVQANLKNKFFPTIELGYADCDKVNDSNDNTYKTSAPYFRIGFDYNVFHKKTHLPGFLNVGLRYGMTSFDYDATSPDMTDPNYGSLITVPFSYTGVSGKASWIELVASLRVKMFKNFYMGWAVRYKRKISVDETENTRPWYVPGYGKNEVGTFNLNYNLTYKLPF